EPFARMQMRMSASTMVHTDKDQQRIKGHRGKRICGHAMHFAIVVDRYYGDSRSKAAHCLTEFCCSDAHLFGTAINRVLPRTIFSRWCCETSKLKNCNL